MSEPTQPEMEQIEALLEGNEPPAPDLEPDAEPQAETDNAPGENLDTEPEVGESQEPENEEGEAPAIDYDLEVPFPSPDGENRTLKLGEMKDKLLELERGSDAMLERENAVMRQADELSQALQLAGGKIPPELAQMMEKRNEEHLTREHQAMLQAIPEWTDRGVFEQERQEVAAVGQEYGFSAQEIGNIADHRVIKFMRDHAKLLAERKQARENVHKLQRKAPPRGQKPQARGSKAALEKQIQEAKASSNEDVKMAAIEKLLKGA